jgi:hypothetical protein
MIAWLLTATGPTNGNGGTLLFPAGQYVFNNQITISTDTGATIEPYSIIFMGTGQGSLETATLQQTNTDSDFFVVNNVVTSVPSDDVGGVTFQDLMITYTKGESSGAAIHVEAKSTNVRMYRMVFVNCPTAVWLEASDHCSMIDCYVANLTGENTNPGIPLMLGDASSAESALETYVAGCLFLCDRQDGTAVQIYGCEHLRMVNCRLEAWGQGIMIQPHGNTENAYKLYFGNVSCFPSSTSTTAGAAVYIDAAGGQSATEIWFAECEFTPSSVSGTSYTGAGIVINQETAGFVGQIRFVDCYSCLWNGAGMNVTGGTNIEVLGGYYSCNGVNSAPPEPYYQSGIAITGSVQGVRVTAAACNNDIYVAGSSGADSGPADETQLYGIYVSGGAGSVRIAQCDLTGNLDNGLFVSGTSGAPVNVFAKHCDFTNLSTPVQVTTPVTNLQIVDCPGYNDQGTVFTLAFLPGSAIFSSASLEYYGPVIFYVGAANVTEIQINSANTHLQSGTFMLPPRSTTIKITYSATPEVLAIGM